MITGIAITAWREANSIYYRQCKRANSSLRKVVLASSLSLLLSKFCTLHYSLILEKAVRWVLNMVHGYIFHLAKIRKPTDITVGSGTLERLVLPISQVLQTMLLCRWPIPGIPSFILTVQQKSEYLR